MLNKQMFKSIFLFLVIGLMGCSESNLETKNVNIENANLKLDINTETSVKKGTYHGHSIEYKEVDGLKFFGGDILLNGDPAFVDQESLKDLVSENGLHKTHICAGVNRNICGYDSRWPSRTIPYSISPNFNKNTIQNLRASILEMNRLTVLNFVPRTNEVDYITIEPMDHSRIQGAAGLAHIGYQRAGAQIVMVIDHPNYQFLKSIIQHEMLHAVGMAHEQNRADRDLYIDVFNENMIPNTGGNFALFNFYAKTYGPYDVDSIMHYTSYAGSNGRGPTMLKKNGDQIPYNYEMSYWDVTTLYYMYITRPL